jgi:hypothetical protein
MLGVQFSRLIPVAFRMEVVGPGDVGVMGGLFMVTAVVRGGGFAVMLGRVLVVFRGLVMMLQFFFVGHDDRWV